MRVARAAVSSVAWEIEMRTYEFPGIRRALAIGFLFFSLCPANGVAQKIDPGAPL
jgi:hypothetical protein